MPVLLCRPAISELVMEEAGRGDPQAVKARLEAPADFSILVPGNDAGLIADAMIEKGLIPRESINDALHISIAATNGIDYLLTWNCRHLANAIIQSSIRSLVESFGYACPVICTPEELIEEIILIPIPSLKKFVVIGKNTRDSLTTTPVKSFPI